MRLNVSCTRSSYINVAIPDDDDDECDEVVNNRIVTFIELEND